MLQILMRGKDRIPVDQFFSWALNFCALKLEEILRESLSRELHAENLEKSPNWIS